MYAAEEAVKVCDKNCLRLELDLRWFMRKPFAEGGRNGSQMTTVEDSHSINEIEDQRFTESSLLIADHCD